MNGNILIDPSLNQTKLYLLWLPVSDQSRLKHNRYKKNHMFASPENEINQLHVLISHHL